MKPKYTSGSDKPHPRVRILRNDVVAIVNGKILLMYCNKIGIPSTGHITPKTYGKNVDNVTFVRKTWFKSAVLTTEQQCRIETS